MKKTLFILVVLLVAGSIGYLALTEKTDSVVVDMPTEEEQRVLEESQPLPETIAESDMEDQFPENAEHD